LKRILVTGGAGFLGSHLCKELIRRGNFVYCLDNFSTGNRVNIQELENSPNFLLLIGDVRELQQVEVDEIYNLACPASPPKYQDDPIGTIKTSVLGAINLLELASSQKAKILQASTSEVYGDPDQHPQTESYWGKVNPIGLRSCYDEGKRCAETLFFDYHRQRGVRIKVARIFNTYGPNMHPSDGRVISSFMAQALAGKSLTVYGDGSQTRSFCYVDDLIRGLIALMESGDLITGPINLGNPVEYTMIELAAIITALCKSDSRVELHPLPSDDPKQRQPDISAANETLNWSPQISLSDGLEACLPYYTNRIK